MIRRARERANARPWEMGEDPDDQQTGDWSDGCGDGDDDELDGDDAQARTGPAMPHLRGIGVVVCAWMGRSA